MLPSRRWLAGLVLGSLLASRAGAESRPDPLAAFERAAAAAESSLQKGELPAAETHCREAVFEGWLLMAALERLEGRLTEAEEARRSATTFAADGPTALQSLAVAHLQAGATAPAIEILRGLAAKDPRDVEIRRLLAHALAAAGQLEPAVQQLDEASSTPPADPEQAFVLATEYLWLKRFDRAERLFAQLVEARPISQTHVLIGRAYRDAGEYGRARAELQAALAQDPKVRRAHYYLGMVILADAGTGPDRLARAIAEFQEELKLAPEDPLTNDQLGLTLLDDERPAEARPAFETAIHGDARALYLYHLGRCHLALDRPADAASASRRALELAEEQGASASDLQKIHYQLGLALRKLGSADAAAQLAEARRQATQDVPLAREGVATEGSDPAAQLPRSQRRELKGRVTTGLARAYLNLGVLQAQGHAAVPANERFAQAAELFAKAAALDPDLPQVQSSLGVARFNARQFDQATGPLTRALADHPEDSGLKRMLAMSWLNTEAWEKAAALLEDDPERGTDVSLQFAYGLALVRSRRAAEAEKVLLEVLARQGDSADLRVLLGQAYSEQGKNELARQQFEASRQLKAKQ